MSGREPLRKMARHLACVLDFRSCYASLSQVLVLKLLPNNISTPFVSPWFAAWRPYLIGAMLPFPQPSLLRHQLARLSVS